MNLIGSNGKSFTLSSEEVLDSDFIQEFPNEVSEKIQLPIDIPLDIENSEKELLKLYAFLGCKKYLIKGLADYLAVSTEPIDNVDLDPVIEAFQTGTVLEGSSLFNDTLYYLLNNHSGWFEQMVRFSALSRMAMQQYPKFTEKILHAALYTCNFEILDHPMVTREFVWSYQLKNDDMDIRIFLYGLTKPPVPVSLSFLHDCINRPDFFNLIYGYVPSILTRNIFERIVYTRQVEILNYLDPQHYEKFEKPLLLDILKSESPCLEDFMRLKITPETLSAGLLYIISNDDVVLFTGFYSRHLTRFSKIIDVQTILSIARRCGASEILKFLTWL